MKSKRLSTPSFRGGGSLLFLAAFIAAYCFFPALCPAAVRLAEDGKPSAVIVISADPTPTELYAAEELHEHIRKATGAALPIATEPDIPGGYSSRVFVGMTDAAVAAGIDIENLDRAEFVLRTEGSDLYIAGRESSEADPLDPWNRYGGTLFGVYEIIERALGAVWAWPGELGLYFPGTENGRVVINEKLNEKYFPALPMRMIGGFYTPRIARGENEYDPRVERISVTREGLEKYARAAEAHVRRHRVQRGPGASTGHQFSNWWNRYGEEHPEWFMMNEDGFRGRAEDMRSEHVSMCVSNPDLHEFIVRLHRGVSNIRLGEVDGPLFCWCPDCLAWDGPQYNEEELPFYLRSGPYTPRVVSDRYARFWKAVHELAAREDPDVTVGTYLYFNYLPAPEEVTDINPGIWGYFTPWSGQRTVWFPMSSRALDWKKQQWKGWADTGMSMVYRPNYLHGGYAMPYLDTRQSGEMLKYVYENAAKGAWFDTLCGEWAVQGPMLYMHLRLLAKPYLEIEDVLDEYYSVFGPAEKYVREYFSYWENYAIDNNVSQRMRWRRFNLIAHEAYPPESFIPAEEILAKALQAAATADENTDYFERVLFLKAGLEHAKLAGRLAAVFDGDREIPRGTARFREARQALGDLVRFRRAHEDMFIFDFAYLASKELRGDNWNLNALFE